MTTRVVVLGGGISGLSAAYYLARGFALKNITHEITLVEKGKQLGGWMQTWKNDKSTFELGPRSIRTAGFVGNNTLRLVHDLGIEDEIISVKYNSVSAQNRFIYANNQLNPVPTSIGQFLRPSPPLSSSIASIYMKGFFKRAPDEAETLYDVISSRFGDEVTKYFVDPFVRGVFAADIKELSMKAAFPGIFYMLKGRKAKMPRKPKLPERDIVLREMTGTELLHKARIEKWGQWSLEGGLTDLVKALAEECEEMGVKIMRESEVQHLKLEDDGQFSVEIKSKEPETGEEFSTMISDADYVISTLPAHALSPILTKENDDLSENAEVLRDVGDQLKKIKAVDVATVNLEFEGSPKSILPQEGFGHLVPSCESSNVLGIVYDSCVFPQHDRMDVLSTRLTCMMGGSWFKELFGDPEQVKVHDLEQAALESVSDQLGINEEPLTVVSRLHKQCIPTYRVGHTDLVEGIEDQLADQRIPLYLGGQSYWGVSVNDCIYNSRFIAHSLIDCLEK